MPKWVRVQNASREGRVLARAQWCASFGCKLRGLSFRRTLPEGSGLLLVEVADTRWASAITMFGMRFGLGVVWINGDGLVVDVRHALPWRNYVPRRAARYILEAAPAVLEHVGVGDRVEFVFDEA